MEITKTSNKKACVITSIVMMAVLAIIVYVNISNVFEWAEKSKKYTNTKGIVDEVLVGTDTYSDDGKDRTKDVYAVKVDYIVDNNYYSVYSDYDMPSSVDFGDEYVVMYRAEDPKMAYIAVENSLVDAYIPYNIVSESFWLAIYCVLGMGLIVLSFCFDNSKMVGLVLSLGLFILGFGGGIAGIKMGVYGCAFLFLFGLVGVLVFYKIFIKNVKVVTKNEDDTDNEINQSSNTNEDTVLNSGAGYDYYKDYSGTNDTDVF